MAGSSLFRLRRSKMGWVSLFVAAERSTTSSSKNLSPIFKEIGTPSQPPSDLRTHLLGRRSKIEDGHISRYSAPNEETVLRSSGLTPHRRLAVRRAVPNRPCCVRVREYVLTVHSSAIRNEELRRPAKKPWINREPISSQSRFLFLHRFGYKLPDMPCMKRVYKDT